MSVVVGGTRGWVLDARALVDRGYGRCRRPGGGERTSRWTGRFKKRCFQGSQGHGGGGAPDGDEGSADVLRKTDKTSKKRKRKHCGELNQGELDSRAFHEKIRSVVLEGTTSLLASARSLGYLTGVQDAVKEPLPSPQCGLAALCEMAKGLPSADRGDGGECVQPLVAEGGGASHLDLFSRVTENEAHWAAVVQLMGGEYVIPPRAAFLLSDFTRMRPLVRYGKRFDLIVMDPPWENKSVKRSRRYSSLPSSQLKRLPIPALASPGCLVVTWVTNRPSHLRFVREELYPHWGLQVVAQWFWVKVTSSGEFVFPLDSNHKKPYEVLVLGRYRPHGESSAGTSEVPVQDQRLIVSVPSALHSQKPCLAEVLKPHVGGGAECLELFARSLQPGWTSWGNEVLKFQHTSYFTLTPADDGAAAGPPPPPPPPEPSSPAGTAPRLGEPTAANA
ncbi:N(6)-adenine-specific methyltransferase METTL4 [Spinachia spinachia]